MHYLEKLIAVKITNPKTILVTSNDVKHQILKYRLEAQIIDNVKIMTECEFEEMFCFTSNPELLHYLINNNPWASVPLKVDIAKQLEKAVYTIAYLNIEDHPLYSYTKQLLDLGLITVNSKLPNYDFIFYTPRISDLMASVTPVAYELAYKDQYTVAKYNYYLDEIEDVIEQIVELIASGVSFEQIHLFAPSNYHELIKQVAVMYNMPIKGQNDLPLLSHEDGRIVYDQISNGEQVNLEDVEPLLVEPIIGLVNKYAKYNLQDYHELIADDFKHAKVTINKNSGLEIHSKINSRFTNSNFENDYFFALGNYQDGLVTYELDTNIIGDAYRSQLPTTEQNNQIEDSLLYNILNNAKNVCVSYATKLLDREVTLANNLSGAEIEVKGQLKMSKYSKGSDQLRYGRANYIKETFNVETAAYLALEDHFDIQYKDNKFTPISKSYEHLKLSYTSINDFYKCSYKFYLAHVLRIKNGKFDNRKVLIGNIVHYVLENLDNLSDLTSSSIRGIIDTYAIEQGIEVNAVDNLYFDKFSVYLEAVCVYMKEEEKNCGFSKIERELEFEMPLANNVSLIGRIDKLLSKIEGDNLFVEIYDYKTGALNIDISGIDYGLNMQNLIYFLLVKDYYKHEVGEEVLSGTYQQQIKQKLLYDDEEILDTMKIKGYSKLKHDNIFKRTEKIIGEEEVSALVDKVSDKVTEAAEAITSNQFDINPKIIKGKNESCGYCPYASICNKTINDYQFIK